MSRDWKRFNLGVVFVKECRSDVGKWKVKTVDLEVSLLSITCEWFLRDF